MGSNVSDVPVIGLTTYSEVAGFGVWTTPAAVLHRSYVDIVGRAGGLPVLLPPVEAGHAELVSRVDGLVLTGGADVDPARYGQQAHSSVVSRPDRDVSEFALLDAALERGMPVLGVCRGMQVLNVALGGSLTQHLPEATGNTAHQPEPAVFGDTKVRLEPGSTVARILGGETACHCYHHQAVDRLGEGLRAVGWAADGTVEAVERPDGPFVLGVQWHPEQNLDDLRLFAALVTAARESKESA
ncbi:gamma-glutamyl-gamma-aminobutyrate hydrolase family protein [Amycolatopsis suaedae]|uniref:Gamma-glutamyl-gamma-aminobutyrate hydrolase family protein n=1 Tax=Amycolatopsis suaedae TaxID=2510978 RepID=A0A4Q7IYC3_9PSEU|nr:gamma-glutamyl-gamma-aminobutyrate hydrolase family protein [Amycolatopsis suaedae]RZQ59252.1 gamma-glutamyl-gamma-aminobutyrate hydrolase family protein [Amycolatopsis suaedae]